jgi:acyl carrier protein
MPSQHQLKDIEDCLAEKLALALKKDPSEVPRNVRLEELGIDSLALIGMVGEVEETYGIELDDAGIRGSHTLAAIAESIEVKLA